MIERIAAVDDDVVGIEVGGNIVDNLPCDSSRHHHPNGSRSAQFPGKVCETVGTLGAFRNQRGHRREVYVVHDGSVAVTQQSTHQVRSHSAESDHSQVHGACSPCRQLLTFV